jgi:arsenate reductase-like glutaredoxin family protein
VTDASKARLGRADALRLARAADRVIVARGAAVIAFDMKRSPPLDAELAAALLGPTGNLRAPTIRRGRTLMVGFNESEYRRLLT